MSICTMIRVSVSVLLRSYASKYWYDLPLYYILNLQVPLACAVSPLYYKIIYV